MSIYDSKCECCGKAAATVAYSEPDSSGHLWQHSICEQCNEHCSSDEDGSPVHMSPEWDGSPETFEACRCTPTN